MNTLLEQSPHSWDTPLSDLADVWDALLVHPIRIWQKLPLAARGTQTSSLPKNIDADETAGEGRNLCTQIHFARSALRDPRHLGSNRKRSYSNVNFALLGQFFEGITGEPYGGICDRTVISPADPQTAKVAERMWVTAGFGGWSVSASNYAHFVMHWYGPEGPWVAHPETNAMTV